MADLSVERASIVALKTYLQGSADLTSPHVLDWWPSGEQLKARTISIIPAGPREEIHSNPRVVRETVVDATHTDYTWRIMAIAQPIQIDVWSAGPDSYAVTVDEQLQELDVALHRGLGTTLGQSNADPFRDGVLLPLDPSLGHVGTVDVITQDAVRNDTEDAALRKQWRATIRGELRTALELTARSVRLLRVILKARIGTGPLASNPLQTYTFDATS